MTTEKIITKAGNFRLVNNIFWSELEGQVGLEGAIDHMNLARKYLSDYNPPFRALTDIRNLKSISRDARGHFGGKESLDLLSSVAIVQNSTLQKLMGNLFLNFTGPVYPSKLFSDEQKAVLWLNSLAID